MDKMDASHVLSMLLWQVTRPGHLAEISIQMFQVLPDPKSRVHVGGRSQPSRPEAWSQCCAKDQGGQACLGDLQLPENRCGEVEGKESSEWAFPQSGEEVQQDRAASQEGLLSGTEVKLKPPDFIFTSPDVCVRIQGCRFPFAEVWECTVGTWNCTGFPGFSSDETKVFFKNFQFTH